MNEIERSIAARQQGLKCRNRSATIQKLISILILLFLASRIYRASLFGAGPFDILQVIASTALLSVMWFYKTTEKESRENVAKGLAGDLLIGMASRIAMTPIVQPRQYQKGEIEGGRFVHSLISISTQQAGILEVSNRIASHRLSNQYGLSIKIGRLPRISSIAEEYSFTPEDLRMIMTSMIHDGERIEIYKTILDLIQQTQPCEAQEGGRKNGKQAKRFRNKTVARQDA